MTKKLAKHAKEIMSQKLVTVNMDDSARMAYEIMREKRIRHLPVVDPNGSIIGIVSDRDLLRAALPDERPAYIDNECLEFKPTAKTQEYMSWPVEMVLESTPIENVAKMMLDKKLSALLVATSRKQIRGIVTTDDLLRVLISTVSKGKLRKKITLSTAMTTINPS